MPDGTGKLSIVSDTGMSDSSQYSLTFKKPKVKGNYVALQVMSSGHILTNSFPGADGICIKVVIIPPH